MTEPGQRWRVLEHRLSALFYACAAIDAHALGLHQAFFAQGLSRPQLVAWQAGALDVRLADLLPRKLYSPRRQQLLAEVLALRQRIERPPPFQVAEQIELFAPATMRSSSEFWFGSGHGGWVKVPLVASDDDAKASATGLPQDPADLTDLHLVTALLVLLEHAVLLDRCFHDGPEWPLTLQRDGMALRASAWFGELRQSYRGPQAAYFRRLRLDGGAPIGGHAREVRTR